MLDRFSTRSKIVVETPQKPSILPASRKDSRRDSGKDSRTSGDSRKSSPSPTTQVMLIFWKDVLFNQKPLSLLQLYVIEVVFLYLLQKRN